MRILVLGAGAIGGHFGGLLAHAGADVTFLVRPKRQKILKNGITLRTPEQTYTVPIKTILKDQLDGHYDLIIIACKAYDLPNAMDAVRPPLAPIHIYCRC